MVHLNDGRHLAYAEYGKPEGCPVLFFHGFPGSRLQGELLHEAGVVAGKRIISIDRPGMGLSTPNDKASILSWANDIAEFTKALDLGKFALIGYSGGAPFAAACAYAIPDALTKVTLLAGFGPLYNSAIAKDVPLAQRVMGKFVSKLPITANIMMYITKTMLKKPDVLMGQMQKKLPPADQKILENQKMREMMINSTLEAFRQGIDGPADEMKLLMRPWGFNLNKIKVPVNIYHGDADTQVPIAHASIYADCIPNAHFEKIAGEGHLSIVVNQAKNLLSLNM